jgi:hypothetical protein
MLRKKKDLAKKKGIEGKCKLYLKQIEWKKC